MARKAEVKNPDDIGGVEVDFSDVEMPTPDAPDLDKAVENLPPARPSGDVVAAGEIGSRMEVAPGLFVQVISGSELKEQDVNAQVMEATKFERLVENIRLRGGLESLPYCHRPSGEGPISIVSGHHRAKAARVAGLPKFPILVDENPMPRSLIRAKQIAHNELTGSPDMDILRKMIDEIDNPEDMLISGLDESVLPDLDEDSTKLDLPHADFDWQMVSIMFLPEQLNRFEELARLLPPGTEMVGAAGLKQFDSFSKAMVEYGQVNNIKNMAAVVDLLTTKALEELDSGSEVE